MDVDSQLGVDGCLPRCTSSDCFSTAPESKWTSGFRPKCDNGAPTVERRIQIVSWSTCLVKDCADRFGRRRSRTHHYPTVVAFQRKNSQKSSSSASASRIPLMVVCFSAETGETATFDVGREPGRFLSRRYPTTFPARKRGFGLVDSRKNLRAAALTPFPQRQCFVQGVFLVPVSTVLYGLPHESLLVVCELPFHISKSVSSYNTEYRWGGTNHFLMVLFPGGIAWSDLRRRTPRSSSRLASRQ
jgi:hypothetical protein